MIGANRLTGASSAVGLLFVSLLTAFACTPENSETQAYRSATTPIPLWKTVVDATLIPTVTPSPTSTPNPEWTPTSTPDPSRTPTPAQTPTSIPTVTPTPSPTPEPLSEREAYCRDHAMPTATPDPGETPTPVPTSPPGIPEDEVPSEWTSRMNEIEVWVRDLYGVDEALVADFARRYVDVKVWKEWISDDIEDWAEDEDSDVDLWEQTYRTLALLSPNENYLDFLSGYYGDRFVGLYDSEKREFVVQAVGGEFDIRAEMIYLHEYAHHVQNVKYDYPFFKDCFKADNDAFEAFRALIEGDAVRTEAEYIFNEIGWDRFESLWDQIEDEDGGADDEPDHQSALSKYLDATTDFRYSQGLTFALHIAPIAECPECEADRTPIDKAFGRPPYTTEQIYYEGKYYGGEGRDELSLPVDLMGDEWELRYNSTIGRTDWLALLAALTDTEVEDLESDLPGWRADYAFMFKDGENRALYLQVALWENDQYIESLVNAFDGVAPLTRYLPIEPVDRAKFKDYYLWNGDSGVIALGIDIEAADRFYIMFLATGPDGESVNKALSAARDNVTLFGELPFPPTADSR